jgi:hypothetical protein
VVNTAESRALSNQQSNTKALSYETVKAGVVLQARLVYWDLLS